MRLALTRRTSRLWTREFGGTTRRNRVKMSLADDLQKLEQLKSSGALSEEEFQKAKKKLLEPSAEQSSGPSQIQPAAGRGSEEDDSLLVVLVVLGVILFVIILFGFGFHRWHHGHYWH